MEPSRMKRYIYNRNGRKKSKKCYLRSSREIPKWLLNWKRRNRRLQDLGTRYFVFYINKDEKRCLEDHILEWRPIHSVSIIDFQWNQLEPHEPVVRAYGFELQLDCLYSKNNGGSG